jgi:hypothetical protein
MTKPVFILLALLCAQTLFSQDFYGSGIQDLRLEMPSSNWDVRLDSLKKANPEARMLGNARLNGQYFADVGIRYKGNSSYFRSRNERIKKLPINIRLDFKNKGQKLSSGHNTIKLSNAFLDPAFVREPLAYEMVRRYMPAPQCNFARLTINNKPYGLYVNSESIDLNFIQKHFGTTQGHLVKCDPDNWKKVRSQSGCPKGENASLTYLNDNTGCYDAFYEVDDPTGWKALLNLIKVLNKTPDKVESVLDVDQTLWMLALNNSIVNLDSYNGSLSHNYYLWFDTAGVAHPLIWDLNMAFGGWRRNFSFEEMKDKEIIEYAPLSEIDNAKRPLISKLFKNPLYRKIYLAHLRTIVQEQLKSGALMARAQALQREIDSAVKQDTMKLYSYGDFQNSLDKTMKSGQDNVIGIRQLMSARSEYLSKHPLLNKPQPVLSEQKASTSEGKTLLSVRAKDAVSVHGFYRIDKGAAFRRIVLKDDGTDGDATAGDGIFSANVEANAVKQYYFAAESAEAAITLPERASYEFFVN